jgi:RHS repeat-associated protein
LEFKYDYLGRRVEELCWSYDGSGWPVEYDYCRRFVYDGWNVIEILDGFNTVQMKLTWGLDLSGSLHGAGGVGGLLAHEFISGTETNNYWHFYDGNGNLTETLAVQDDPGLPTGFGNWYIYGPYGRMITENDTYGQQPGFRFSTKWRDDEQAAAGQSGAIADEGLYYYGHRYFSPSLGRWISRDPIGEKGGKNLYAFVKNDPVNDVDPLGLWKIERKNNSRAVVISEYGDTVNKLAQKIRLEPEEYNLWLKAVEGGQQGDHHPRMIRRETPPIAVLVLPGDRLQIQVAYRVQHEIDQIVLRKPVQRRRRQQISLIRIPLTICLAHP